MMRKLGKGLGRLLGVILVAGLALWAFAPEEPVDRTITFDEATIGPDPAAWLAEKEAALGDVTPGTEKRIIWAGEPGVRTPVSIVYIHGFSATSEEIRPVPDKVAAGLGANLVFTRLTGHGRGGDAMASATAGDWFEDMAEAMALGRRTGERVLVISTSTGATLAALSATDPALSQGMAGVVMVSPNFGLKSVAGKILDLPFARWWGPMVAGERRSFTPSNDQHARFWTTEYPTVALFPMAALIREARREDFSKAQMPALFLASDADQVIDPTAIPAVAEAWGGGATVEKRVMTERDDPYSHVIAGDILSPAQTEETVALILDWAQGL